MSLPPEQPTIDEVRAFWNANPLWTGEASEEPGSPQFFASHTRACLDMIGGAVPARIWPDAPKDAPILDLGCGIGFWLEQFWERGHRDITGADLSTSSLALAGKRCEHLGASVRLSEQNAEAMTFPDGTFQHVNCIGVIHHSPAPEQSIAEIARVLRPGGTAAIAVYNWNIALRAWPAIRRIARSASSAGATLKGRGRETMMETGSARELVRLYDGADNPIGYAYSRQEFTAMLEKHFTVKDMFGYVFPSRILHFALPGPLFRLAEKACPFMICGLVTKPARVGRGAEGMPAGGIPATAGGSTRGS
jgi:SAM-dependent methyltransferase